MEEGSMRADVNVSVRKPGDPLGTRTETKNVNSVRFVMAAIEYEANRQVDVLESGGAIVQETRLFDPDKVETRRSEEQTSELPSLMRISYAVFCLKKKNNYKATRQIRY